MKTYICVCPVCNKYTIEIADFFSISNYIEKEGNTYPAMPCPNIHKANEVRTSLGIPLLPEVKNIKVKGASRLL